MAIFVSRSFFIKFWQFRFAQVSKSSPKMTLEKEFMFKDWQTGEAKLVKREYITGDVNVGAAFDATAAAGELASVSRQKIAEIGGGWSHGIELEMILDRNRALIGYSNCRSCFFGITILLDQ